MFATIQVSKGNILNIISLVKLQGKIEAGRSRGLWSLVSDGVVSLIFLSEIGGVHFNVTSHPNFVLSSRPTDMTTREKTWPAGESAASSLV